MNENPKISVIIPMYKCAQFVEPLIDSICAQSMRDIEIICVIDGPDPEIEKTLNQKQKEDERIQYIVQEHSGAGAARNTGIAKACGEYLIFLDADDLFAPELLEKLFVKAEKHQADIVMCTYSQTNHWFDQSETNLGFDFNVYEEDVVTSPEEVENYYSSFIHTPWNKLIRHSLVVENNLSFSNTRMANDIFFVIAVMTCANRITVIKEDLLTVRRYINDASISSNRAKYTEDFLVVFAEIKDWLMQRGIWKEYRETYLTLFGESLRYNLGYDYNEKFINGIAKTINSDLPWRRMGNAELKDRLFPYPERLLKQKHAIEDDIAAIKKEDDHGREIKLHMVENKIDNIKHIFTIMKEKYGRDLNKRDNLITALVWSLRSRGWQGTLQKIKEKRKGAWTISPQGVICSGHITLVRTAIDFFLPVPIAENTSYRNVEIDYLSIVARGQGFYPFIASGNEGKTLTPLGPSMTNIWRSKKPVRDHEVRRISTEIVKGFGIRFRINFEYPLIMNRKGDLAENNQPVSVTVAGKITLK